MRPKCILSLTVTPGVVLQVCGAGVEALTDGGEDLLKFAAEGDLEGVQVTSPH